MHRTVAAVPTALVAVALATASCGGSTGGKPTASVSAPAPTATTEAPAATPTMVAAPSGSLIFRASGNSVSEIYRVDTHGQNLVNLTATGNPAVGGTPSPDGGRVALTKDQHVVLVNPDGSEPADLGRGVFVSWSPDGARILYGNFGESYGEWWIMNRDGSDARLIVPRCAQCASPQWLPDGQSLVAEIGGAAYDAMPSLFVIDTNGARLRSLPGTPDVYSELSLSPDSKQVLFVERSHSGTDNIKVMSIDGAGLRTVWTGNRYIGIVWSPDSTRIAFDARVTLNPGEPSPPPVDGELVVVDLASGESRVLDGAGAIYGIDWSPDGQTLAYAASRDPVYRIRRALIYTIPALGGTPTRISDGPWYDMSPKWSDDGETITFVSDRSSRDGIYALDPTSGQTTLLQRLAPTAEGQLSPPTAVGGCVTPPKFPGEGYVTGCLSPDGLMRTSVTDGLLAVSSAQDGSVVATSPDGVVAQNSPSVWSPDRTRVAYYGGAARETLQKESWLYLLDVASAQSTPLAAAGAFGSFDATILWSRDGSTIYFTAGGYCPGGCVPGYLHRVAADGSGEQQLTDLRVVALYGFAP